jgi:hypothetical protein
MADRVWEASGRALIAFDASRLARLCSAQSSSSCQVSLVSCMRQRASASAPSWARREAKTNTNQTGITTAHALARRHFPAIISMHRCNHAIPPRFGIID